jgi:outer membrane lipase/esterase
MKFLRLRAALAAASAVVLLASCGGSDFSDAPIPALYSNTVVFGASISDTGNACNLNPASCPPPPYAPGRASNGILWIETVAAQYGATVAPSRLNGWNYAYGGARTGTVPGAAATTTPSMVQQLDQYLARVNFQVSPRSLIVIDALTFGNNISATLTQGLDGTAVLTQGVTDIVGMINRLYAAGARNILVLNSPNIGRTPLVASLNNPAATLGATALSVGVPPGTPGFPNGSPGFNGALGQQITGLRALLSNLNLVYVDVGAFEAQIVANPAAFNLTNVTAPCFNAAAMPPVCATPDTYFYWDGFHPTFALGQLLASTVLAALTTP